MIDSHACLAEYSGNILATTRAVGVDFVLLHLSAEVQPMACRELVFHPQVLPKFEAFVLMAGWTDATEAEALKKWNENLFNEVVLAGPVKERCQLLSLLDLLLGKRAGKLRERRRADARSGTPQITATRIVEVGNQPLALDELIEGGQSFLEVGNMIRIGVSTLLEFIVVSPEIVVIEKLRDHSAKIVRREIRGLAVA